MRPRRLFALLVLLVLLCPAYAAAQDCDPVVISEACERNLRALETANRKLDQRDGQIAQERASHEDTREALGRAHEEIGRMRAENEARWSPWVWASIGAGSALGTVLLVVIIAR